MAVIPLSQDIYYPDSDGKPLESEAHLQEMLDLREALRKHFQDAPDVYVGANMFIYYQEGNPRVSVGPDVFVARGVSNPKELRRVYKLWKEGTPPCAVFEITSASTHDEDLVTKKKLYERLGVEEYFLHDVLGEYLRPRLQGYRLEEGRYRRIHPEEDGSLVSRTLGLRLRQEGRWVRLIDAATGNLLLRTKEVDFKADQEEAARREAEVAQRREARARRKAEKARQQAEQRANEAEERARQLEEELARLRQKLSETS